MTLKMWWRERSLREQVILMAGCTMLLFILSYLLLEPVIRERDGLAEAIPALRADLAWMQAHSDEMRELLGNTRQGDDATKPQLTLSLVQATLRETGLLELVDDLRGTTQSGISLNITDVAFSDLVRFLFMIRARSQGGVETAEITRSSESQGIVTANLVLREARR